MIPKHHMKVFIDIFETLNIKVLWKYDDSSYQFPKNVFILKEVPQNDVLAHKNVKLFITNGGVCSILESVYHGVPMIVTPFFGDQVRSTFIVKLFCFDFFF